MTKTAREQIVEAALANGWHTDGGYNTDAHKSAGWAGRSSARMVHVEFSVRGGLTYAYLGTPTNRGGGGRILRGTGRLARVLSYVKGEEL